VTNEDSEWWPTEWWPEKEPAVTNVAVTNENSEWWPTEWWPGKASRDQRGRWPLRGVEYYGFGPIARYGTCPTSVVWAANEGFIDQMGSLT